MIRVGGSSTEPVIEVGGWSSEPVIRVGRESVVLTSLPPVVFMFNLPPEYPLVQPELELECEWMNEELVSVLPLICSENLGMGVLFFCYEAIADVVKSIIEAIEGRNLLELPQYATSQFQNMERIELLRRVDDSGARSADYHFNSVCHDCEVCFQCKPGTQCLLFRPCEHVFCRECVTTFFFEILNNQEVWDIRPLGCLAFDCSSLASQQAIQSIIGKNLATCEMCGYSFCVLCYRAYHGLNECHFKDVDKESLVTKWDSADEKERIQMGQRFGGLQNLQVLFHEGWIDGNSKPCPRCRIRIEKTGGCNKMQCSKCDTMFCWLCYRVLDKNNPYLHFIMRDVRSLSALTLL
uniref:RBR-type E3 ubiquitin transferase n=1 Tax=Angiostrongylus cantonensis TaxID=6313 RepID=A0A0K0D7G8_ANGCA